MAEAGVLKRDSLIKGALNPLNCVVPAGQGVLWVWPGAWPCRIA